MWPDCPPGQRRPPGALVPVFTLPAAAPANQPNSARRCGGGLSDMCSSCGGLLSAPLDGFLRDYRRCRVPPALWACSHASAPLASRRGPRQDPSREPIPPGSTEWRGPPSRSQTRGEVRPHFRPPAASCTPRSCRGWYQADRHPGAWQCTGRCLSAPRLGAHKATRGPSWGGSWRSAGLSSASASSASRACAACLKNRASNSPTASETLSHAARPIGTRHHALMCRPPAGGTSHVRTLTVRLCPLHDGPAGPSRPRAVRGALRPPLVPGLIPGRPAARRLAVHHQMTRPMLPLGRRRRAITRHPAHDDQPRPPLVPVLAALRVTPPVRTLHPHDTIRTRVRSPRTRQQRPSSTLLCPG
jgi:hypothetical protein